MRVVLLAGSAPNQHALAAKLAERHELVGVIASRNEVPGREPMWSRMTRAAATRSVGRPLHRAWSRVLARYNEQYPDFPAVPKLSVSEVNEARVLPGLERMNGDLYVVSGTNLVRSPLIEHAGRASGMLNLHTGLSPYVKGGPNCTNWCLAMGWFHLIGNTVMWIDPGVDSGDIASSARTDLGGGESLEDLHWKVLEHGHEVLLDAVGRLAGGRSLPRVPQAEIGAGRTFRNREWGARPMMRAVVNFRRRYTDEVRQPARSEPMTVREDGPVPI